MSPKLTEIISYTYLMGVVFGSFYAEDLKIEVLELHSKYGNDVTEKAVEVFYGAEYGKINTDLTLLELVQLGPMHCSACTVDTEYILKGNTIVGTYDHAIDESYPQFPIAFPDEVALRENLQEAANNTYEESEKDRQSALDCIRDVYKEAADELAESIQVVR